MRIRCHRETVPVMLQGTVEFARSFFTGGKLDMDVGIGGILFGYQFEKLQCLGRAAAFELGQAYGVAQILPVYPLAFAYQAVRSEQKGKALGKFAC